MEGLDIQLSGRMRMIEPLIARLYARRIDSETRVAKRRSSGARTPRP